MPRKFEKARNTRKTQNSSNSRVAPVYLKSSDEIRVKVPADDVSVGRVRPVIHVHSDYSAGETTDSEKTDQNMHKRSPVQQLSLHQSIVLSIHPTNIYRATHLFLKITGSIPTILAV